METYYKVTHILESGLEVVQTRDTVERAYLLYKMMKEDGDTNIKLEEVSNNGIALLRYDFEYKTHHPEVDIKETKQEEAKETLEESEKPKTLFEMMFGISKEEYNECLVNWNRLTGENIELLD